MRSALLRFLLELREAYLERRVANGIAIVREGEHQLKRDEAQLEEAQNALQRVRNRLTVTAPAQTLLADALRRRAI